MIQKISRQTCIDTYPSMPLRDYDKGKEEDWFHYPNVLESYTLGLPSKTFRGHTTALGQELCALSKTLSADRLIFLCDYKIAWLYQDNDYPPAQLAIQYLKDHGIGKRFNGALVIDMAELPAFIKQLAWLVRCNASLAYVHFIDPHQQIVGYICQYGGLHLDLITTTSVQLVHQFFERSNFIQIGKSDCWEIVGNTSAISGRQTTPR